MIVAFVAVAAGALGCETGGDVAGRVRELGPAGGMPMDFGPIPTDRDPLLPELDAAPEAGPAPDAARDGLHADGTVRDAERVDGAADGTGRDAAEPPGDGGAPMDAVEADTRVSPPDAAPPEPDAAGPEPDASAPEPDALPPEPDASSPEPDALGPDAGPPDPVGPCALCHGTEASAAPPPDTHGLTDPRERTVGAHESHLRGAEWRAPIACAECHVVPPTADAPGHVDGDGVAEVRFGPRAAAGGVSPAWDGETCANTWCHGATLGGAVMPEPAWRQPALGRIACGDCHGAPPPPPHPTVQGFECSPCHPNLMDADPARAAEAGLRHIDGRLDLESSCSACHGGPGGPAPPSDLAGNDSTRARGVGAHTAHLTATPLHPAYDCTACHVLPAGLADARHIDGDGQAEVVFGPQAGAGGVTPIWDGDRCSVACHGAALPGGENTRPRWTEVGTGQAACGACHAAPPPAPHPEVDDFTCQPCHPNPIGGGHHADGRLDLSLGCNSCHGGPAGPAPPRDLAGREDTASRGVGAHASHLRRADWRPDIPCAACHVFPDTPGAAGHLDGDGQAEVVFGAAARANGVSPRWDGDTCAVYCHGETLPGGAAPRPVWTSVGTGQAGCGGCHGAPPPAPHPAVAGNTCAPCHPEPRTGGQHLDGTLQVAGACTDCHGSADGPAPPRDLSGEVATTARGVGAHQAHLAGGDWHVPMDCAACHRVPGSVAAAGHMDDDGRAEVVFGARAGADGVSPTWNGNTCTVYCHGASLPGGSASRPVWTRVGDGQTTCEGCHGNPPPAPHPPVSPGECAPCHPDPRADDRHVDGTLDLARDCTACHGGPAGPAPPADTRGNTGTQFSGVGAHAAHLAPSNTHAPIACAECHLVPAAVGDVDHLDGDGRAEVVFGPRAEAGGVDPQYDGARCSVYCHGAARPLWTRVGQGEAACGTCHGAPPPAPHPFAAPGVCTPCHPTDQMATRHIDGVLEVDLVCNSCHGGPDSPAPPRDLRGNAGTGSRGVGAHAAHLRASDWRAPIACQECHRSPAAVGDPSHLDGDDRAEVIFGAIATSGGQVPAWNGLTCAETWCHGGGLRGGTLAAPAWTRVDGSQAACGTCHGLPPAAPHPAVAAGGDCGPCHPFTGRRPNTPARHADGVLDVSVDCTSCHGGADGPAPPRDNAGNVATAARGVGAHQAHLRASATHGAVACTECHVVPAVLAAPGHMDGDGRAEVRFGPLAAAGGTRPAWDGTRCNQSWCHGASLDGGTNKRPQWTRVDGTQGACGTCHGVPPPPPHVAVAAGGACGPCHPFTGRLPDFPRRHGDGVLDAAGACNACHGGPDSPAPPVDLSGNASTAQRGVGAHGPHLRASNWHSPIPCNECHAVPATVDAPGHLGPDRRAEITFGALARAIDSQPAWDGTRCNQTYCHGSVLSGGTATSPVWTRVDGTQGACGSCHGLPPQGWHHEAGFGCHECHTDVVDPALRIINPRLHMNAELDVSVTCPACHEMPPHDDRGACRICHFF